jgi:dUTPase
MEKRDGADDDDATTTTTCLRVKKLSATATVPTRGSDGAAGYDLSRYVRARVRVRVSV